MWTVVAAIIGGIFTVIAALIGRAGKRNERTIVATAEIPRASSARRIVAGIVYLLVVASAVAIPIAGVVLFRAAGEAAAGGRYRYSEIMPVVSFLMLFVLLVSLLGFWRKTDGFFRLLFGTVLTPPGLFRAGLAGLVLALVMDIVLMEPILSLLYER